METAAATIHATPTPMPVPGTPPMPPPGLPPDAPPMPTPEPPPDEVASPDAPPAPCATPLADLGSLALGWDGRTYAFGGHWSAYRQAGRRQRARVLRRSGASHWLQIDAGGTTQIALYDLPEERGRLYAAVEAARSRFGGDFMGVFDIRSPSISEGYWLVALSDDVVLADTLYSSIEAAREACGRLQAPGRRFGTVRLPVGFSDTPAESCGLDEFLDLSQGKLTRMASSRRSFAAAAAITVATLVSATVAHALLGQIHTKPPSEKESLEEPLRVVPPEPFAGACEKVAAEGLYTAAGGWALSTASCAPGLATLAFRSGPGGQEEALLSAYPEAYVREGSHEATVSVPLAVGDEEAGELWDPNKAGRWLQRRMHLLDAGHVAWRESGTAQGFRFRTQMPLNRWLAVLGNYRGLEVTRLTLHPEELVWEVEGRLHANDG